MSGHWVEKLGVAAALTGAFSVIFSIFIPEINAVMVGCISAALIAYPQFYYQNNTISRLEKLRNIIIITWIFISFAFIIFLMKNFF